jgi:hypothetical protein
MGDISLSVSYNISSVPNPDFDDRIAICSARFPDIFPVKERRKTCENCPINPYLNSKKSCYDPMIVRLGSYIMRAEFKNNGRTRLTFTSNPQFVYSPMDKILLHEHIRAFKPIKKPSKEIGKDLENDRPLSKHSLERRAYIQQLYYSTLSAFEEGFYIFEHELPKGQDPSDVQFSYSFQ